MGGRISSFGQFKRFHPGLDLSENINNTNSIPPEIGDLINLKFLYKAVINFLVLSPPWSQYPFKANLLGRLNHNQLS